MDVWMDGWMVTDHLSARPACGFKSVWPHREKTEKCVDLLRIRWPGRGKLKHKTMCISLRQQRRQQIRKLLEARDCLFWQLGHTRHCLWVSLATNVLLPCEKNKGWPSLPCGVNICSHILNAVAKSRQKCRVVIFFYHYTRCRHVVAVGPVPTSLHVASFTLWHILRSF